MAVGAGPTAPRLEAGQALRRPGARIRARPAHGRTRASSRSDPEEIAAMVVWLATEAPADMTPARPSATGASTRTEAFRPSR
jgi:hypothetical protein